MKTKDLDNTIKVVILSVLLSLPSFILGYDRGIESADIIIQSTDCYKKLDECDVNLFQCNVDLNFTKDFNKRVPAPSRGEEL